MIIDFHRICLKSCVALDLRAWLSTHPLIPSFHMPSDNIMHQVGFPLPNGFKFSPSHLWFTHRFNGDTLSMVFHGKEHIVFHDVIQNVFVTIDEDAKFYASCE